MTHTRFNTDAAIAAGGLRVLPRGGMSIWFAAITGLFFLSEDWELRWAGGLFLFAPLILLPMAFPFSCPTRSHGVASKLWKWIERLQLPAATILAIAFLLPVGKFSGLFAIPWLMMTCLIALVGLLDFRETAKPRFGHYCRWIGMLYLPVGGAWAVLSR